MQMLGARSGSAKMDDDGSSSAPRASRPAAQPANPPAGKSSGGFDDLDDDIPF